MELFGNAIVFVIFMFIDAFLLGHMVYSIKNKLDLVVGIDIVLGGLLFVMLAKTLILGGV